MIKKLLKALIFTTLFCMLFSINTYAAIDMPTIEYWKDGMAYTADNVMITDCIAYDIQSSDNVAFKFNKDGSTADMIKMEDLEAYLKQENENAEVWCEFKAEVPEDFSANINIQLIDDLGNTYDFVLYEINDYVLNIKLPFGHYISNYCMAYQDYKSEYPFMFPEEITIDKNGTAAYSYEVKALWNNEGESELITKADNVEISESEQEVAVEETNTKEFNVSAMIGIILLSVLTIGLVVTAGVLIYLKKRG